MFLFLKIVYFLRFVELKWLVHFFTEQQMEKLSESNRIIETRKTTLTSKLIIILKVLLIPLWIGHILFLNEGSLKVLMTFPFKNIALHIFLLNKLNTCLNLLYSNFFIFSTSYRTHFKLWILPDLRVKFSNVYIIWVHR